MPAYLFQGHGVPLQRQCLRPAASSPAFFVALTLENVLGCCGIYHTHTVSSGPHTYTIHPFNSLRWVTRALAEVQDNGDLQPSWP